MDNYYPPPDIGHVSFSGLSEPCSVGSIVEVVINAHGESAAGSVVVECISPSGQLKRCQVIRKANSFTATFTPNEVGTWQIGILYDGEHIRGSPFSCNVYDANLVQVYGLDVGLVGQELKFSVNAAQAGGGSVKVSVLRHGHQIPSEVVEQGNSGVHRVKFTPDGAGQYKIHVLFNNMEVKGSPFILDIADASSVSVYGENLRMASVDRLSSFMIHAGGTETKDISVTVTAPSGRKKRARVIQLDDVSYKVEWKAVEAGEHSIDVRLYNQSVYESPFVCNVGDPELVTVRNMPEFINANQLGKEYSFQIDASAAGSGNLEIMINGGRVACRVRELGGRTYLASFTATHAVPHIIEMRFNGEDVRFSPWKIPVRSFESEKRREIDHQIKRTVETSSVKHGDSWYSELSGPGLQRASVGKASSFEVTGDGIDPSDVDARLIAPDGSDIPITKSLINGKIICEYIVRETGEHRLEISICGKKIEPYPLYVSAYSVDKVNIQPLGGGSPGQPVQFIVDAVEAGKGQLEISVNQGKVPNNVQMQGAGRCLVTFIPQYSGKYVIDVTFNGEQVHGCPIRVDIMPKQVGQPVSTSVVPQQPPIYVDSRAVKSTSIMHMEERTTSPLISSATDHSNEMSTGLIQSSALPRSPELVRAAKAGAALQTTSQWETTSSPRPWTSPLTADSSERVERERDWRPDTSSVDHIPRTEHISSELIRDGEDANVRYRSKQEPGSIGYTVAQYGDGAPSPVGKSKIVTTRSSTDDLHSSYKASEFAETRYSSVSPGRVEYEYQSEVRSEIPPSSGSKPRSHGELKGQAPPPPQPTARRDYIAKSESRIVDTEPSGVTTTIVRREFEEWERHTDVTARQLGGQTVQDESASFVTDSRSYGFASDGRPQHRPYWDDEQTAKSTGTSETAAGRSFRYFGDTEEERTGMGREKSEAAGATSTYEHYGTSTSRPAPVSDRGETTEYASSPSTGVASRDTTSKRVPAEQQRTYETIPEPVGPSKANVEATRPSKEWDERYVERIPPSPDDVYFGMRPSGSTRDGTFEDGYSRQPTESVGPTRKKSDDLSMISSAKQNDVRLQYHEERIILSDSSKGDVKRVSDEMMGGFRKEYVPRFDRETMDTVPTDKSLENEREKDTRENGVTSVSKGVSTSLSRDVPMRVEPPSKWGPPSKERVYEPSPTPASRDTRDSRAAVIDDKAREQNAKPVDVLKR
ncbi:hypothetical protein AB6A40_001653 [Gnathostoma spinigerum]|uniref:Filamin n=1 Tax=Gnathostoma spinigerum TaxID=75299 RepID=A0ABD6EC74_9BILA